jgi:hypothetical protein
MKTIVYEKLEDFVSVLKLIEPKDMPVYMTMVKGKKTEYSYSASIQIQVIDVDLVRTFKQDDMPEVMVVPDQFFEVIKDAKWREMIIKEYRESIAEFDKKIADEYDKAVKFIMDLGFKIVINAVVV